jgi:hypothetical protein
LLGRACEACAHRIQRDVPREHEKIHLAFDDDALEAALQQVPYPIMPAVEMLGICAVHRAHAARQIRLWGLGEQMVVIAHEAIGIEPPAEVRDRLAE